MGLIAGLFYAGSTALVGFDAIPKADAIRAMQIINAHFRNWLFAAGFFGALAVPVLAMISFSVVRRWPVAGWVLAGLLSYLVGAFGITLLLSIPLNESLVVVDADRGNFTAITEAYFDSWRFWNWVRIFASLLALGFLVMAFREEGRETN
jgi:uncharacterized membrane protein